MVARSVRCCPALKPKASRNSGGISKRIELASAVSGTTSATLSEWKWTLILPLGVGVGARQELHHREQMPEMLAVVAPPAAENRALVRGCFELRFGEDGGDRRPIFLLELARVGRDAGVDRRLQYLVDFEQLRHEAPAPVEPLGHAPRALLGPVAEADRPFGRELAMISDFLDRFMRELAQKLIARLGQ